MDLSVAIKSKRERKIFNFASDHIMKLAESPPVANAVLICFNYANTHC